MVRTVSPVAFVLLALAACAHGGPAGGAPPPARQAAALPPGATATVALAPPVAGLRLAWHDEFDGAALDTTRWTAYGGARRDAVNDPRAVAVGNGVLSLRVFTENGVHSAGFVDTARKFAATYGWYEARIRFASAPGEWCAFWLQTPTMGQPVGDPATAGAEIDVAEHRATDSAGADIRDRYAINLHWDGYGAAHRHLGGEGGPPPGAEPLQGAWHAYAVEWSAAGYTFYLDGVPQWSAAEGISRRPEFIKVTCEVQDRIWAGRIPAAGYGPRGASDTGMDVDWVRVWQRAP